MADWVFDIFKENYDKIKDKGKEVEGRVPDMRKPEKHYHKIVEGDNISIRVVGLDFKPIESIKPLEFTALYNRKYDSVDEMIFYEGLSRVLPELNSTDEAVALYHSLPGYKERIEEYGIYAVGLGKK